MYIFKSISISQFDEIKFRMFLLNKLNFAFDKIEFDAATVVFDWFAFDCSVLNE